MTAAGTFAEKAEALGWKVDRDKRPGWRGVQCVLRNEQFTFEWTVNERTGNYVFAKGEHRWGTIDNAEEWSNLAAALRIMAEPGHITHDGDGYYRLPFDPAAANDADVLASVNGRELTWRNSITGTQEAAIVPWNGRHTKLAYGTPTDGPARRILTFASYEAGTAPGHDTRAGFRAVRLSALVAIGDRLYRPRSAA